MFKNYHPVTSLFEELKNSFSNQLRNRGFFDINLISNWSLIVDNNVAKKCFPIRMIGNILILGTIDRGFFLEFNFLKNSILERINFYFGGKKIEILKLEIIKK